MNKEEVRKVVTQIRNNQERYNHELQGLIQKLEGAHIDTKHTGPPAILDQKHIAIGDQVRITNPSRFGGKGGTVVKLTQTSRVMVATTRGKAYKNVHKVLE